MDNNRTIKNALRIAKRYADGGDVDPDQYTTPLAADDIDDYNKWKQQNAPSDSGYDYDLPGAYKAGFTPDAATGHFDDRFKKPNHPTFSTFSQYAKDRPDLAGTWNGDQYIPPPDYSNVPGVGYVPPAAPDLGPSWLQQAKEQTEKDIAAYQKSGVPGLMAETETAKDTGLGFAGSITPAAKAIPKFGMPPKAGEVGRSWFDLSPQEVKAAQPVSESKGTSQGAVMTGFNDGQDRYVKVAKSLDHAKNEVLASKLYELAGVPVAKNELTQVNGKPAVASHIVPGEQLSEFGPWDYEHINGLQQHMPADAWLANGDVIGAGTENPKGNIMVAPGANGYEATRIDFGGALRYAGLGGLKPDKLFGPKVGNFIEGLTSEHINPTAAEAFHGHEIDPRNVTAQRISQITDDQIKSLVYQYGPTDMAAKEKLANTLIARRDDLAKEYGIEKSLEQQMAEILPKKDNVVPIKKGQTFDELQAEWEAKLAESPHEQDPKEFSDIDAPEGGEYTFKDPRVDASNLLNNHTYAYGRFDIESIANDMYKMAEKNPEYVDQVYKHLPADLQEGVNAKLSQEIQRKGDPWEAVKLESPKAKQEGVPAIGLPLMKLNKTHGVDELVNSIKNYHIDELNVGKTITAKQKDKVQTMIGLAPSMKIADALKKLGPDEQKNILSWLPPSKAANVKTLAKHVSPEKLKQPIPDIDKVGKGHSLYQVISAIKNYSPQYAEVPYHAAQSIPKELSKFSPHEIYQEMEGLSLTQKQKVMEWLSQSTKEKIGEIGIQKQIQKQKGFIGQEYYDALEPIKNWQNYKVLGATSVRPQMGHKAIDTAMGQGYNLDLPLYKGGSHYKSYPDTIVDPVTEPHRLSNPDERAFFLSDHPTHAAAYGQIGGEYIARPEKAFTVDWKELTGSEDYSSHHMKRIIEAAREKGADLVVIKGVADVSGHGHVIQDQYAFLNTNVLRGPNAKFDPAMLHLRKPLAGLVGGGLFSYGMLRGQEGNEQKFARGGVVASHKIGRDAFLYLSPKPPKDQFAQCGTCRDFTGTGCMILGQTRITKGMSCGLYVRGQPRLNMKGREQSLVSPEQAGLVNFQVRCENCKYGGPTCKLYEALNEELPDKFDLETKIDPKACCNGFTRDE